MAEVDLPCGPELKPLPGIVSVNAGGNQELWVPIGCTMTSTQQVLAKHCFHNLIQRCSQDLRGDFRNFMGVKKNESILVQNIFEIHSQFAHHMHFP